MGSCAHDKVYFVGFVGSTVIPGSGQGFHVRRGAV